MKSIEIINQSDNDQGTQIEDDTQINIDIPRKYKVLMINDDFTPMDFVIDVLIDFFGKDEATATAIMLEVHHKGSAVCGVYTRDIAETKALMVIDFARQNEHPLQCEIEPDS